jgi:two-component system, OmpR family, sensor histidine kinase KdpD
MPTERPRPDPDELLAQIQTEENKNKHGRLKIFLGYAAGVGKTYAMLEAAHQRQKQGVDVVASYIETHGRVDTEAFLNGLEVLPRRQVEYHGIRLPELDVDAVLKRRPGLVLVDEFAHTNAPGSRHPKRYQDVEEILDAGIDVYTTLNIQHLESLNDVVAQVTGMMVRETVPDSALDEAFEIEVIDLPPDELLARLKEGKVYIPEQAQRAIQQFFRKGNLSALREMSLRRAAERVDTQMRTYMRARAIPGPWPATERLLVCISPSPLAEKLVRTTRRLADELNAEWFALYVEMAQKPELNQANRERIGKTLQLAEELGARTRTLTGNSIPETVLGYAHKHNVTKIIVGKPVRPRWRELLSGSLVDQLVYASGDIDIYVISSEAESKQPTLPAEWRPHRPLGRYLVGLMLVSLATLVALVIRGKLEPANLVMLYLASTVIAAVFLGRGPSLLVSILSVLAFDFFLIPPYLTLAVSDTQYLLTFIGLFIVSLVVSSLTARVREQAEAAIQREAHTSALYTLGRDLTSATDLHQVAEIIIAHISQVFGREVAIFLPENGQLQVFACTPDYKPDTNELGVATWAFEHDQPAGLGTDTLPAAALRCQPLKTGRGLIGVLAIHPKEPGKLLTPEQRQTFDSFAHQAALAVERASLAEQARQTELLQATEKLQNSLLNSISHDLRTPLVSITGALSSLREKTLVLDQAGRDSLIETADGEAGRLNRLVGNLLNMTRIEAGAMHLKKEPTDIQDAIGAALEQLGERIDKRQVKVNLPSELRLIALDSALFEQALVNLLDNAVKYSPPDTLIEINVLQDPEAVKIEICDRGIGIPTEDLERVFDKFYRVQRPESVSGTGLGLSICKGIVEAHGGTVRAENRPGGGTIIMITLPKEAIS